jgi:hypothetical protein
LTVVLNETSKKFLQIKNIDNIISSGTQFYLIGYNVDGMESFYFSGVGFVVLWSALFVI